MKTYEEQRGCDVTPHDSPPHSRLAADHHLNVLEEVIDSVHPAQHHALEQTDYQQRVRRSEVVDDLYHVDSSLFGK